MTDLEKAMAVLRAALDADKSYAHSWHCNIAMMCYDAIRDADEQAPGSTADDTQVHNEAIKIGNDAASRFMKLAFNVETSKDSWATFTN